MRATVTHGTGARLRNLRSLHITGYPVLTLLRDYLSYPTPSGHVVGECKNIK